MHRRTFRSLTELFSRNPLVRNGRWLVFVVGICGLLTPHVGYSQQTPGPRGFQPQRPLAQPNAPQQEVAEPQPVPGQLPDAPELLSPRGLPSTLKILLLLTVLSLAPSVLIMTTCFIRFIVVMGLLRQALGTQQLPPNQVIISLCLFLTMMVMGPVWKRAYDEGIVPYTRGELNAPGDTSDETLARGWKRTAAPIRRFMADQIERTGNGDTVWMFVEYQRPAPDSPEFQNYVEPQSYDDLPLSVLVSSYMLSELKTAFIIGFQVYLPFLVIDMVIASILISMGMMMLPPVLISLPFKLLLFVMIDGWYLTVGMLLESVR